MAHVRMAGCLFTRRIRRWCKFCEVLVVDFRNRPQRIAHLAFSGDADLFVGNEAGGRFVGWCVVQDNERLSVALRNEKFIDTV